MQKKSKRMVMRLWLVCMTGVVLVTSYIGPKAFASSFQNQIDNAKDKKQELEEKQKAMQAKIQELAKKKDNVLVYIEELDNELETLTDEITQLNGEIATVNQNLQETEEELIQAQNTEEKQYETMKKRIQYMYENGETSFIEVLLSSENIADLLNQVEYVSEIADYDNSLLDNYKATKVQVEEMKKKLEDTLEEKNLLSEELAVNQDALENMIEDKQKELTKYEENISQSQSIAKEYREQIVEQEQMIEDLLEKERKRIEEEERKRKEEEERKRREEEERKKREEERKKQEALAQQNQNASNNNSNNNSNSNTGTGNSSTNNAVSKEGFLWPVPASGRITCGFGSRTSPTVGASSYHQGIDVGAASGSNIVATKSGTVVTASYSSGAGNYVMIYHGDGVYSVYMHCSKLLVSVGQSVSRGDVIALVGSTGISTGPHLHFAISMNGSYVDPQRYVNP